MAMDPHIDRCLQLWSEWLLVGDGSGYPAKSVLHPMWSPPSGGITPSLKVAAPSIARQVHREVGKLPVRLANTVVVHYVYKLPLADQAQRLQCQPSTVYARLSEAHRMLRDGGFTL